MADINVERKGPSIWPWIIGLIVLALLIWALVEMFGTDDDAVRVEPVRDTTVAMEPAPAGMAAGAAAASVQQFLSTCRDGSTDAQGQMGMEHVYTADCLDRFADAADELSRHGAGTDVGAQLQQIRERAGRLRRSEAASTEHAGTTREAFTQGAAVLEQLSRQHPGAGVDQQVNQARQAAESVQPGSDLLEQRENVHTFFRSAGQAMERMAGSTSM